MKKTSLYILLIVISAAATSQQVQTLKPARLGIFKNGTCFVKREGMVAVTEKSFYIKAPEKVLTGTYWVVLGKETTLNSVIVKTDTFKISKTASTLGEFLEANTGQQITLYGNAVNTDLRKLSGKLIRYDQRSGMVTVTQASGSTVITTAANFTWFETAASPGSTVAADSIIPVAKVKVNKEVTSVLASTISLENGVQWQPSYLLNVINDKEAKLEMKATIVNHETAYLGMPVDIIIGSPEMFYKDQIDPACITYINESMLMAGYDNNARYNFFNAQQNGNASFAGNFPITNQWAAAAADADTDNADKDGQKNEDLYYYNLGVLDLEKNARVIVPVMSTTINYSELYTADLPVNSPGLEGENSIQAYHSFVLENPGTAPLTSGPVFVLGKTGQPLSQSKIFYTAVKGNSEIKISRAVDVQVKNDEEIKTTEKAESVWLNKRYYTKQTVNGQVAINNLKDKKIKIRINKVIPGYFISADNNGKNRKKYGTAEISWEVEIAAGQKLTVKYSYYTLE